MVYNKTTEITDCNFTATSEKYCVYNQYCIWTDTKDSAEGYASCTSRWGSCRGLLSAALGGLQELGAGG